MPTRKQLRKIRETEMEFPETRREDDPMYVNPNKNKITMENKKSGVELIAEERKRQIDAKGYDAEHDEMESAFQLSAAAAMYIANAHNLEFKDHSHYDGMGDVVRFQIREMDSRKWAEHWPWDDHDGRAKSDVMTSLIKAGALIAAEIDRLQTAQPKEDARQ